jgi:hypothetical protein
MTPYFVDLRQNILQADQSGERSQRDIASIFHVSLSFVESLLRQVRTSGRIEPWPATGGVAAGATLYYLPPYSPDWSPIEPCCSKLKAFLRAAKARTREALDESISPARLERSPLPTPAVGLLTAAIPCTDCQIAL